jgi:hypothetical protein
MAAILRADGARRLLTGAALGTLAAWLGGCSMSQDLLNAPHYGYQADGSYVLSQQEEGAGCRELQDRTLGLQERMQQLSVQAVDQMQQLPGTVVAGWQRLVGAPGDGVPAIAEYKQAHAQSEAVGRAMVRKGCNGTTTASVAVPPVLVTTPSVPPETANAQPAGTQQPGTEQAFAQSAATQQAYSQPAYAQPTYAQPTYAQPGYAQPPAIPAPVQTQPLPAVPAAVPPAVPVASAPASGPTPDTAYALAPQVQGSQQWSTTGSIQTGSISSDPRPTTNGWAPVP